MQAVESEDADEVGCVLIPLRECSLLLPDVSVAEILPWRRVRAVNDVPVWCLGLLGWRGEAIPVLRYEVLNGAEATARKAARCMIVLNRMASGQGPGARELLIVMRRGFSVTPQSTI